MPLSDDDIRRLRETEFPVTQHYTAFNHAGVAPVCTRASVAAAHFGAQAARLGPANYAEWLDRLEKVRDLCSWFIGAQPEELCFVRNTSHGLSIVAAGLDWRAGDNVVTTDAEFPANMYPWLHLKDRGVEVRTVAARERPPALEDFDRAITGRTRLVAVSHVQFGSGCRLDLRALSELVHSKNALLCVDAIQSLGVIPMDVVREGVDFLAADGHKWLCAFEGTGVFYCRRELLGRVRPPLVGWNSIADHFEYERYALEFPDHARKFEEGSLPLLLIFALGKAIELFVECGPAEVERRALATADLLKKEIADRKLKDLAQTGPGGRTPMVFIAGDFDLKSAFEKLQKENVQLALRGGGLRLAPHFYNTADDVKRFFEIFDKVRS